MKTWLAALCALASLLFGCSRSDRGQPSTSAPPQATIPGIANPSLPNVGLQPAGAPVLDWWRADQPCPPGTTLVRDLSDTLGGGKEREHNQLRREGKSGYQLDSAIDAAWPRPVYAVTDPLVSRQLTMIDAPVEHEPYELFEPYRALEAYYVYCAHEDGRLGGPWSALYEDHKTWITGWYVDDQRHGRFRAWNPQGKEMGAFEMTLGTGEWTTWAANGQVIHRGRYQGGVMEGEWSFWHDNGQLEMKQSFTHGRANGSFTVYRADGSEFLDGAYQDGSKHGPWQESLPDGTLDRTTVF